MNKRQIENSLVDLSEVARKSDIDCKDIAKDSVIWAISKMPKKELISLIGNFVFELMDYSGDDLSLLAQIPLDRVNLLDLLDDISKEIYSQIVEKEKEAAKEEAHKIHLSLSNPREL